MSVTHNQVGAHLLLKKEDPLEKTLLGYNFIHQSYFYGTLRGSSEC